MLACQLASLWTACASAGLQFVTHPPIHAPIRVAQVVACINEQVGGPARSVTQLAAHLAEHGVEPTLFTINYRALGHQVSAGSTEVLSFESSWATRRFRGWHRGFASSLASDRRIDLIHNHGLWMQPNRYARLAAKSLDVPLVISPRGMMDPWSLSYSRIVKRLAWWAYERRNVQAAALFHATSQLELSAIRQLGFQQPIAVIPNGIEIQSLLETVGRDLLERRFPALRDKRWLLFLSRLHPKKGIEGLLRVWSQLAARHPETILVLAGSEISSYEPKLRAMVRELQLSDRVVFTGNLVGEEKCSALQNASVFALPTFAENFGIVIAESLAAGTPVITTYHAPWSELVEHQCGWWIENTDAALLHAVSEALAMDAATLGAMGMRGRELVLSRYQWGPIAEQMKAVYEWLLGRGHKPECVFNA